MDILRSFNIEFKNELGIDAGGLKREFYFLLSEQIFDPKFQLFSPYQDNNSSLFISKNYYNKKIEDYYFSGQFIAKAIIDQQTIHPRLNYVLLKMILQKNLSFLDLQQFDSQLYKTLRNLLKNDITDDFDLYFEFTYKKKGKEIEEELIPNGHKILVTNFNKDKYIYEIVKIIMFKQFEEQIKNFINGFYSVIPLNLIQSFTPEELGILISGEQKIYASEIIDCIKFDSYTDYSKLKPILISYLKKLSKNTKENQEILRGFLQFVTGSGQVPYGGLRNLKNPSGRRTFIRVYVIGDIDKLPTAATCSNLLKIPNYPNEHTLKKFLEIAIKHGRQGFAFY